MDELDDYGSFNTRYEGVGQLRYVPGEPVDVAFEARQLFDGRLLIACVSLKEPIPHGAVALDGHLLSEEPFSTMWGRSLTEIYRSERNLQKVHYVANMMRVRYTQDAEPRDRSIQFALHNFIPGPHTDISQNRIEVRLRNRLLTITPVGNYRQQAERLLRFGGNLRTSWVTVELTDAQGNPQVSRANLQEMVTDALIPFSLALGTSVTCPQTITFDSQGNRNDVELYSSSAAPFADFVCVQGWDSPVTDTVEAWFSTKNPCLLSREELGVSIHQHLDACSGHVYSETRALVAATLLDVLAGRYATRWAPHVKPYQLSFKNKLGRLLSDLGIQLKAGRLDAVMKARNSLVHSGQFLTSEGDKAHHEYRDLFLLGRTILLRMVGVPSTLHEAMDG